MQPRTRPDAAGATSEDTKGLNAAGPDHLPAALSRETRSGAGRRPRFLLPGDIPLNGEARAADPSHHGSAQTGRLGRRDGRKRNLRGGLWAALSFPHRRCGSVASIAPAQHRLDLDPQSTAGLDGCRSKAHTLARLVVVADERVVDARDASARPVEPEVRLGFDAVAELVLWASCALSQVLHCPAKTRLVALCKPGVRDGEHVALA
jgi:hypothetical protein